jgi:hypothetical protein
MKISPEAKQHLAEALATEESFIIHPSGERADELSKTVRVVQLAQQDFDVIIPPSAATPLKEFSQSPETQGVNFSPMLIVHPDEPEHVQGAMDFKQKQKQESKLIRTWWPKRIVNGMPDADGHWFRNRNWELQIIKETMERYMDSIIVEERTGYHCQHYWGIKVWRLKDGSILENPSGHSTIGCNEFDEEMAERNVGKSGGVWEAPNNLSHFQIRSEAVRGLVVNLCPYDFIEEFPELAAAMAVKKPEAAPESNEKNFQIDDREVTDGNHAS